MDQRDTEMVSLGVAPHGICQTWAGRAGAVLGLFAGIAGSLGCTVAPADATGRCWPRRLAAPDRLSQSAQCPPRAFPGLLAPAGPSKSMGRANSISIEPRISAEGGPKPMVQGE